MEPADPAPTDHGPDAARRGVRFGVWVGCVGLVLGPPASAVFGGALPIGVAGGLGVVGLTAFVWLLLSTPPGAIRLPTWLSVVIIGTGAALSLFAAGAPAAIAVLVGLLTAGTILWRANLARAQRKAWPVWWAAVLVWHPSIGLMIRDPGMHALVSIAAAVPIAALTRGPVSSTNTNDGPGGTRDNIHRGYRDASTRWALWLVSVGAWLWYIAFGGTGG